MKPKSILPETLSEAAPMHGDLSIIFSKKTGQAVGRTLAVIEGAKRIDWLREFAAENRVTPSKAIRLLLNEAIEKRIRSSKRRG